MKKFVVVCGVAALAAISFLLFWYVNPKSSGTVDLCGEDAALYLASAHRINDELIQAKKELAAAEKLFAAEKSDAARDAVQNASAKVVEKTEMAESISKLIDVSTARRAARDRAEREHSVVAKELAKKAEADFASLEASVGTKPGFSSCRG